MTSVTVWRTGGPTGALRRAGRFLRRWNAARSIEFPSHQLHCLRQCASLALPHCLRHRQCANRLRVCRGKTRTEQSAPPAQGRPHRFGYPGWTGRRPAARHENQCDAVARSRQPAAVGGHNNLFTDSVHCSPSSENHGPSTLSSLAQRLAMPAGWPRLDT